MTTVKILTLDDSGEDQLVGSIGWEGELILDPPDSRTLKSVSEATVIGDQGETLTLEKDPEGFLSALHRNYYSPYLRATKVEEGTEKTMDTRSTKPSPPSLKSLPNYGSKGHWVTMGAQEGGDEPGKHGGARVYIGGDGKIEKGPKGTTGKKPSELKDKKPKTKKERKPKLKPPTIKKPEPPPEYDDDDQVVLPDDVDDLDLGNLASEMGDVYDDDDPLVIGDSPPDSKIDTDEDAEEQVVLPDDADDLDTSGWESEAEESFDEKAPPEEHRKALSESVDKWIKDSDRGDKKLTPEQKKKYAKCTNEVFAKMPAPLLVAVRKSLMAMVFVPDEDALNAEYTKIAGKPGDAVSGFCYTSEGAVYVDGADEADSESSLDMLKYGMNAIHGVYAHEICHTLEKDTKHSRTKEWESAWNDEIVKGKYSPSSYSQSSPTEGFAEFGRMVVADAETAKRWFPKCYDYWKKQGWLE